MSVCVCVHVSLYTLELTDTWVCGVKVHHLDTGLQIHVKEYPCPDGAQDSLSALLLISDAIYSHWLYQPISPQEGVIDCGDVLAHLGDLLDSLNHHWFKGGVEVLRRAHPHHLANLCILCLLVIAGTDCTHQHRAKGWTLLLVQPPKMAGGGP